MRIARICVPVSTSYYKHFFIDRYVRRRVHHCSSAFTIILLIVVKLHSIDSISIKAMILFANGIHSSCDPLDSGAVTTVHCHRILLRTKDTFSQSAFSVSAIIHKKRKPFANFPWWKVISLSPHIFILNKFPLPDYKLFHFPHHVELSALEMAEKDSYC